VQYPGIQLVILQARKLLQQDKSKYVVLRKWIIGVRQISPPLGEAVKYLVANRLNAGVLPDQVPEPVLMLFGVF